MRTIRIEKLTLNIGAGKDVNRLEKGIKLIKNITGIDPVKTFTSKRIPAWGLRPGLPIACKLTLRKKMAIDILPRLLEAKDHTLRKQQFDNNGNLAFGIPEYIDIGQAKYDPEIGIMGLEVCVTLERPGFRIRRRNKMTRKIPKSHQISKDEAIDFMKENFKIKLDEE